MPRVNATLLALVCLVSSAAHLAGAPRTLTDEADRSAFRSWFTLLADLQFEAPAPEVTDCAALVRFAYREALRAHTPEWARRVGLIEAPRFPDVRSGPRPTPTGWPLFRTSARSASFGEFADARTIVRLNARPLGRDAAAVRAGDLLVYYQPGQSHPDHLMVFVGGSHFDASARDWVVYHTGPDRESPGEVRKVRLADLQLHPSPRWRPVTSNQQFVGVFRLALL